MSKTLIVMRHAKSSWENASEDIERPLNERGQIGAVALGDWLRTQTLAPDETLCSNARRVQQTGAGLKIATPLTKIGALYMASEDILLKHVQKAKGDTVLLLAHNPGIGEFAEQLAQSAPNNPRFFNYPSGATTVFSCDIENWSDLKFGDNIVTHFITPKELT